MAGGHVHCRHWGRQMTQHDNSTFQSAEIVPLWQHHAKRDVSALSEMRGYWESLRSGRLVPQRSEIDPREISGALEYGFILERLQPGAIRFRLAGMHLCDLMGMEVRGMPLRALISPTSRACFSAMLERVFTGPEIHEYEMVSEDLNGSLLRARLLTLPLKSDDGTVDRAIGCFTTEGVVGLAPRRFRVMETRVTSLINGEQAREVAADEMFPIPEPRVAGFAEQQAGFEPESRAQLRLVASDTPKS